MHRWQILSVSLIFWVWPSPGMPQSTAIHGDPNFRAKNVHSGNQIRVTFWNHGMLGARKGSLGTVFGGEWPINSGLVQLGNSSAYVTSELRVPAGIDSTTGDTLFAFIHPTVFCEGWDANLFSFDELGNFIGFEPLPGFHNVDNPSENKVAMSHQPISWPGFWPDKTADLTSPGWPGSWNGYFGLNVQNADQESYYVMDDYTFHKKVGPVFLPPPIASQPDRAGLGLRMAVRGLQWANPDAEDAIFWIYDITNIGEHRLNKTAFGLNVGASVGALIGRNTDFADDAATFIREENLTVNFDFDNIGTGGYSPVPWLGFAFLESPGNPFDGIDNDADGADAPGGGHEITMDDFALKFINTGDPIVLINYQSEDYDRTVATMPAEGVRFKFQGIERRILPGQPVFEIPRNGVDDNLNGIIDEADSAQVTETGEVFFLYANQAVPYLAKDYLSGAGLDNLLIDERRDDGIDNDGDWDPTTDDVGLDGAEGTGDFGEGDGLPTPAQNGLPGEPHLDAVDVNESDQIGLTSFFFYEYGVVTYSNDEQMWFVSRPGFFDSHLENVDADYVFSTGYFPLLPGQTERFSVGMIYGEDETDIIRNKQVVQEIYDANYNFCLAPKLPKIRLVPGDRKVTIYWDDGAEDSKDRFLNAYDFQGYKIYRATDPRFEDSGEITDGYGYKKYLRPIGEAIPAVFDKIDGVAGFFPETRDGVQFFLGSDRGLTHMYVDSGLVNGQRYFYAVTAFDSGDLEKNCTPTETAISITINASGEIEAAPNVSWTVPGPPASGYVPPEFDIAPESVTGQITGKGLVRVRVVDPLQVPDNQRFELQFFDTATDGLDNDFDWNAESDDLDGDGAPSPGDANVDGRDLEEFLPVTTGFQLVNITDPAKPDVVETVQFKEYRTVGAERVLIKNLYDDADKDAHTLRALAGGFEFFLYNPPNDTLGSQGGRFIGNGMRWSRNIDVFTIYPIEFRVSGLDTANLGRDLRKGDFLPGVAYPRQYRVVFHDELVGESNELALPRYDFPSRRIRPTPTNFKVYDLATGEELPFAFRENRQSSVIPEGFFSSKDEIWFFETLENGETIPTWYILNRANTDTAFVRAHGGPLASGDTLYIFTQAQFNSRDKFVFGTSAAHIDREMAKSELDQIRVVPNPYVVAAAWEPKNPFTNGRGPRAVKFINLPQRCTIRIYALDGTLVRTLEHESPINNSIAEWDLLTKDQMDVAYGMYVYHVSAAGIGEKVGRLILIK